MGAATSAPAPGDSAGGLPLTNSPSAVPFEVPPSALSDPCRALGVSLTGSQEPAIDRSAPPIDIVPLGGLGEFGLNMMAISCGETTIVIDAGSMFPEPDLLGVDLIIPDLTYLESRRGQIKGLFLTHGHEDHIGAVPYVLPYVDGPLYGTPLALALVAPKLEEHDIEHPAAIEAVTPASVVTRRPVHDRVHPRHAQHARLRGHRRAHSARHADPHRRFQDRPDAARRRALRPAPLRSIGRGRRAGDVWRQHEHRSARVHRF